MNFGDNLASINVRLCGAPCHVVRLVSPHTVLDVSVPPSAADAAPMLTVAVDGLSSANALPLMYRPPQVHKVQLMERPPAALASSSSAPDSASVLVLSGVNFGGTGGLLEVYVRGAMASDVALVREHTRIRCVLPWKLKGTLALSDVVVSVNGVASVPAQPPVED